MKNKKLVIAFLLVIIGGLWLHSMHLYKSAAANNVTKVAQKTTKINNCAANTDSKKVIVSVSERHMWACNGSSQGFDSAVITGMENLPDDRTPRGTYHVYSKQTNRYLDGSDSTGSWHDYVSYWMPFYGDYGFHDATWRSDKDFGNIDPNSAQASHGCVELLLVTAKWLYNWVAIGTTVTIRN